MLNDFRALLIVFLSAFMIGGYWIMQHQLAAEQGRAYACNTQIAQQNAAIDDMQRKSQEMIKERDDRAAKAIAESEAYQRNITVMMAANVPKDCVDAMHWMVSQAQNMKRQ